MARYDPAEVQDCANRLYAMAGAIVRSETAVGLLLGGAVAGLLAHFNGVEPAIWALLGAVLGGISGYQHGMTRSLHLRLRAQEVLCLVEIEAAVGEDGVPPSGLVESAQTASSDCERQMEMLDKLLKQPPSQPGPK